MTHKKGTIYMNEKKKQIRMILKKLKSTIFKCGKKESMEQ